MKQGIKNPRYNNKRIKWYFRWNNWQIKIIWRANKINKKVENLNDYYYSKDYGDKELKFKYFKLKLAHFANTIDGKLFKQIFGHKCETLANKLINTTKKEENQIIVKNIDKNKEKLYKMDPFHNSVIQPSDLSVDLIHAIDLILGFNKKIQLDLIWKYKN